MKDWILDNSWLAWVPAMIPCAIGAAWFAWWALELGSWMVWMQSAGYVSGLLAWLAAVHHARGADKRVEIWRRNSDEWRKIHEKEAEIRARLELVCRGQQDVLEMLMRADAAERGEPVVRRWVQ
jgi:hypothetical protein